MTAPDPYYQDQWTTIYCGDAREILPRLGRVGLILMDPPYGNGTDYADFDDTPENVEELASELMPHVLDRSEVALVTPGVANLHRYPSPRWVLAWVTPSGIGSGPWGFSCWQPILAYGPDPYLRDGLGRRPDMLLRHTAAPAIPGHPCPKPPDVWRWLITRASTRTSDVVLDPLMGSGTTLRAAMDCGRRSIGIELSETYCAVAVSRLAQGVFDFDGITE